MGAGNWTDFDKKFCWHPYTQHGLETPPLPVVKAEGAWLELEDGRRILDAISSWWTTLHGHRHPRLIDALKTQAEQLDHVLFAGVSHPPAALLAKELVSLATTLPAAPGKELSRAFFSDSGSTAVEIALKAAWLCWIRRGQGQRKLFVSLEGGYHGDTCGAMAVSDPDPFFREYGPLLFETVKIPATPEALEATFRSNAGKIAGLIIEPMVQGAAGMVMHPPSFLAAARQICNEHETFLIADEVFTGFGRTGKTFACEHANIAPDFLCLAKGITGGMLPLAATLATEEIFASFLSQEPADAFLHGHSYTANPLACAVALESIRLFKEEDTPRKLNAIGEAIEEGLQSIKAEPWAKEVRRLGGITAVEITSQNPGYLNELSGRLKNEASAHDVLLRPLGNVLYAVPPSCTSQEESKQIAKAIETICRAAAPALQP